MDTPLGFRRQDVLYRLINSCTTFDESKVTDRSASRERIGKIRPFLVAVGSKFQRFNRP